MSDINIERNGYEFPFTPNELLGGGTLSDIISTTEKIFNKVIKESDERWAGSLDLPLYDHQRAVIKAMIDRETALRQGIVGEDNDLFFSQYAFLGDDVSTGKTWAALGFIQAAKTTIKPSSLYLNQRSQINCWSFKACHQQENQQTNLVIAPLNVCSVWAELLQRQTQLTYIVIRRKNFINAEDILAQIRSVDVVIVPNTLYLELNQRLLQERFTWTRAFIDDWTSIPLTQTRATINAQFTWILTSAWYHFLFEHNYHNIWYWQRLISMVPPNANTNMRSFLTKILDQPRDLFASPGSRSLFTRFITNNLYRDHLIVRTDEEFIKKSINIQEPEIIEMIYSGDKVMQFLYSLAGRGVRQYIEQERFDRALELVGATIHSTEAWNTTDKALILRCPDTANDCCPICFEDASMPVLTNCCQKLFCTACLFRCCQAKGDQTCPTCRGHIRGQLLHAIYDIPVQPKLAPLKVEALISALKEASGQPTLLYFPSEPFYGLLRQQLREADLNFEVLSGGRDIIRRKLERFKEGKIDILIFFNRNQILNAEFPFIKMLAIYPDDISQTDRARIIMKTQCIGRIDRLKVLTFKNIDAATNEMQEQLEPLLDQ